MAIINETAELLYGCDYKPVELSGGEQQRVTVAGKLLLELHVVLANEPTGNIDTAMGGPLLILLIEINEKQGVTFVILTHNASLSERCHRVIKMIDVILLNR